MLYFNFHIFKRNTLLKKVGIKNGKCSKRYKQRCKHRTFNSTTRLGSTLTKDDWVKLCLPPANGEEYNGNVRKSNNSKHRSESSFFIPNAIHLPNHDISDIDKE